MLKLDCRDIGWWYWLGTAVLITAGVFGWPMGFHWAIKVSMIHLVHFIILERTIKAFSVQVRAAFLLLVVCFYWEPLRFLYWWPAVGLWTRILFSYCFLARTLSLMSWNRKVPFTIELLKRTYFSPPVCGSVLKIQERSQ